MLDRFLLPVLVVSTVAVAGVVGSDVVSWRLTSASTGQQAPVRVPDTAVGSASVEPAPVLAASVLRLLPTPTSTPTAAPSSVAPAAPIEAVVVPRVAVTASAAAPATVSVVQANLYQGLAADLFAEDLAAVVADGPDVVTLNEAGHRTDAEIRPAGYASYRASGSPYLAETPVLWRTDRWTAVDQGSRWLTTRKVKWGERAVNWVTLRGISTGQVLTVISAHPAPTLPRTAGLLPVFVDGLAALVHELEAAGPVIVGGDLNAGYHGPLWPGSGLAAAGLTPTYDVLGVPAAGTGDHGGNTIDYVLHTAGLTPIAQATRELHSDHDAVLATFALG